MLLIRVIPRNPRFHSLLRDFVPSREKRCVLRLLVAPLPGDAACV